MANASDNNVVWNRVSVITDSPAVRIIVPNPFNNSPVMNTYFNRITQLLEYNTNKLVIGDRRGKGFPANKRMIREYLEISRPNIDKIMSTMLNSGVLMEIRVRRIRIFYMNPKYAICGRYIDKTILDLFEYTGDNMIGIQNFSQYVNEQFSINLKNVETYYVK